MQLQPDLVVPEPFARQPRPAEGMFALLDVLPGGTTLVMEPPPP